MLIFLGHQLKKPWHEGGGGEAKSLDLFLDL